MFSISQYGLSLDVNRVLFIYLFIGLQCNKLKSHIELLYQPWMTDDDDDDCGAVGGMNDWLRKPKYLEKTYPSAAL
jgi:hypothetical protein